MTDTTSRLPGVLLGALRALPFSLPFSLPVASLAQTAEPVALPRVEVRARTDTPASLDEANSTGSRLGLTPLATPASIEIVRGETAREKGDGAVLDAVTRATGISSSPGPGNGGSSLAARGFSGHGSVMQLFDGTRLYVGAGTITFPFDTWSTDRIEVLRGASSVMFGEGAIGGAVNIVPKKPVRGAIENEARIALGSDDSRHVAFGSGGAIDERWSYRVDISHRRTDGFMAHGDAESLAVGGALRLDVSPQLNFTLSRDEGHQQPQRYYGVPLIDGRLDDRTKHQNYNVEDSVLEYRDRWTRLEANWTASDQVSLRNQLYHLDSKRHWRNAESYTYVPATGRVTLGSFLEIGHDQEQVGNRTDLSWKHAAFGLDNALLVGIDLNRIHFQHTNDSPYYSGPPVTVDPFDPQPGGYRAQYAYSPRYRSHTDTYAVFMEDRLALTERWSVVGGLRYDRATLERNDLVTPASSFEKRFAYTTGRVGVVFAMTPTQSFYGQYSRATDPLGALITTSAAQTQFDLTTGRQAEVGFKQLLGDQLGAWSVAAYRIEKNKILSRDPANPNVQQQIGQQSSQGIEATLELALARTVKLEANLAKLQARYDDFKEVVGGGLVSRDGNTPTGVPERTANLWLDWRFLPQWKAAAGARHVGPRQVDTANTRQIGSYTVADATLGWEPLTNLALNLHVFNVFDRDYPLSTSNGGNQWLLGRPRSFELSAHLRF